MDDILNHNYLLLNYLGNKNKKFNKYIVNLINKY